MMNIIMAWRCEFRGQGWPTMPLLSAIDGEMSVCISRTTPASTSSLNSIFSLTSLFRCQRMSIVSRLHRCSNPWGFFSKPVQDCSQVVLPIESDPKTLPSSWRYSVALRSHALNRGRKLRCILNSTKTNAMGEGITRRRRLVRLIQRCWAKKISESAEPKSNPGVLLQAESSEL